MEMRETAGIKDTGKASGNGRPMGRVLLEYLKAERVGVKIDGLRKLFGENHVLKGIDLDIDPGDTETNIVVFRHVEGVPGCRRLVARLRDLDVLVSQLSPDTVRLVTHRHIRFEDAARALELIRQVEAESA